MRPRGVGFFNQAGEVIVFEREAIAIGQGEAGHVAGVIELDGVALAAIVATGDEAVVGVVADFQLAAQYVGYPTGAGLEVS